MKDLNQKGVEVYKRTFILTALATSFFRVPEFRKTLLELIVKKDLEQLEEGQTELDLYKKYDWENEF